MDECIDGCTAGQAVVAGGCGSGCYWCGSGFVSVAVALVVALDVVSLWLRLMAVAVAVAVAVADL